MKTRTALLVSSVLLAGGCAGASERPRRVKLDYCLCETWGAVGAEPEPGYQPPPRPAACERILKRRREVNCPVPP